MKHVETSKKHPRGRLIVKENIPKQREPTMGEILGNLKGSNKEWHRMNYVWKNFQKLR